VILLIRWLAGGQARRQFPEILQSVQCKVGHRQITFESQTAAHLISAIYGENAKGEEDTP
jgi:hypothetical protein